LNCEAQASYQPSWGGIDLSTSWNYQYSLNSLNDNDTYTRYYNFGLNGYVDFPFGLQLRTDATYNLRSGTNIQKGEDDEILWNAGATWRFLKKKEAELSAYWADILGKKKSYGRMATSDGFYEYRTQEIKGYFIVTFKYNFRLMM
jgi:outer membrane usher protein FimD/PapC